MFKQARFIPHGGEINLELVYEIPEVEEKVDNGKYAAIDIGVDNLAALAWNTGERPVLLKGTPLKSVNQYYNKQMAKRRSICELMNGRHSSKRIARLIAKRNRKIEDYLHKASRKVIDLCAEQDVSVLVVGKNKGWKQEAKLGRRVNQSFVQLPFVRFIQMLQYKAETIGMKVVLTEESYTSGTSFLDGEVPTKDHYDKSSSRLVPSKRWPENQCRRQWCLPDHAKSIPECECRRDRGRSVTPCCSSPFDERSLRLRLRLM
ncbi:RNA-guided endonuclease InsQ/TnpB family protein [Mitsuokella multacida]|uniref:RNA-guided endonuclease InsQ/TnpB family protein n=1 Tax=Mitsuokella multacida TaxID=52226 RepID=UPI0026670C87|nr:transposase [Mitsuokella multacida]